MSRSVLIVDDDPTIREIVALTLSHVAGFEVREADSGRAGLEAVKERRPDAILLDVMMPGLDGPSTLESLRADAATKDIPVIFLTAKLLPAERERLERLGASGLIGKPFDALDLVRELQLILSW
jgi:CheY-like chemotaxis protein